MGGSVKLRLYFGKETPYWNAMLFEKQLCDSESTLIDNPNPANRGGKTRNKIWNSLEKICTHPSGGLQLNERWEMTNYPQPASVNPSKKNGSTRMDLLLVLFLILGNLFWVPFAYQRWGVDIWSLIIYGGGGEVILIITATLLAFVVSISISFRRKNVPASREIQGEFIIIPIASGIGDLEDEIFTLNETGRAIWEKLDGKKSLKEIAAVLSQEFQAPLEGIEQDVSGLTEELLKRRMLVEAS